VVEVVVVVGCDVVVCVVVVGWVVVVVVVEPPHPTSRPLAIKINASEKKMSFFTVYSLLVNLLIAIFNDIPL